jgi:O-Antigen ligase
MKELFLSQALFGPLVALVGLLALAAPFQTLLMLDLALVFLPGQWLVGGVRIDPGDLAIAGVVLAILVRGRFGGARPLPRGALVLWLALGAMLCAAYMVAPGNQAILTGPGRIAYQLYRYCWKPILYFPLAALLLGEAPRAWMVLDAAVLGGDVCAALALPEGWRGLRAQGPFDSPNTLGAVLVVPMLVAVAGLLSSEHGRTRRLLHLASLLLLGRVMLYSGSRGALMAVCLGTAMLLWQAMRREAGRLRLWRLAPWVLAAMATAIAVRPSLLEGPNIQRFLTIAHPMEEDTFQWRMKERWPHFWAMVEAHPWVGVGTYVDPTLGTTGNTPHNGYIAIAAMSGLPALGLYLVLGGLALHRTLRRLRRSRRRAPPAAAAPAAPAAGKSGGASGRPPWPRAVPAAARRGTAAAAETDWLLDAVTAAAIAGLLVHNFDDTVVLLPALSKVFWLLIGLALAPPRLAAAALASAVTAGRAGAAASAASAARGATDAGAGAAAGTAAASGAAKAAAGPSPRRPAPGFGGLRVVRR